MSPAPIGPFRAECAGCHEPGPLVCPRCRFAVVAAPAPVLDGAHMMAAFEFGGAVRQLLHGLKYRNRRRVAHELTALAVRHLGARAFVGIDVVTWAPTGGAHLRSRGFDQAELIARAVARHLGVPCRRLLYRAHGEAQSPQTGRSRAERLAGAGFRAKPGLFRAFGGSPGVLVVDDIVTSGATLNKARDMLLVAGAGSVRCMALAATPDGGVHATGQASPARRRTRVTASVGSSSTWMPTRPTADAATTLVGASSRNAVRSAGTPSLSRAS